ncbi:MAG: PAS domain S-box protein [Thaumarchaeota archaeon]|nr:PAS domain S-box protein [Nitrososphaerota archaeon]
MTNLLDKKMILNTDIINFDLQFEEIYSIINNHSMVEVTDIEGNIIFANKKFCDISQYSEQELIGQNHRIIKSGFHTKEFYKDLWSTITSGKTWHGEFKNKAKDGSYFWNKQMIMPRFDNKKTICGYISIGTDITTEKELSEKLTQIEDNLVQQNKNLQEKIKRKSDEIIKKEKLSMLGTMASRLAHDLKNPLTVVKAYSDILSRQLEDKMNYEMKMKVSKLKNSITDMSNIIEDVLDFSRTVELDLQKNSIFKILMIALENVDKPKQINVNINYSDIAIICDSKKIEAVFSNLLSNAIQALEEIGEINVRLTEEDNQVLITVEDTGPGILEDDMPRIFEPLFTTKQKGTGLGLSICKNIINLHGGDIIVKNAPTTFIVTIPKNIKKTNQ